MKYAYRIKLADTDAAGRIYFASAFRIAHEAFEHVMDVIGQDLGSMITDGTIGLPVVHAEARFEAALSLGETISVHTTVPNTGGKSVTFQHELFSGNGHRAAVVTITHAAVSGKTGKAVTLPTELREALQRA